MLVEHPLALEFFFFICTLQYLFLLRSREMQRLSPASWFLRRNKALVYLCSRAYCLNREVKERFLT
ncbi:hypothetical protein Plhal703r1_c04g0021531 [Plasmopara halstedii]